MLIFKFCLGSAVARRIVPFGVSKIVYNSRSEKPEGVYYSFSVEIMLNFGNFCHYYNHDGQKQFKNWWTVVLSIKYLLIIINISLFFVYIWEELQFIVLIKSNKWFAVYLGPIFSPIKISTNEIFKALNFFLVW